MPRNPEHYPLVELRGMQFFAYHGCYAQERKVGNRFVVELKMRAEESQAACGRPYSNGAVRRIPTATLG